VSAVEAVDIVVFDIAGTRYGADLSQVRRIDHDEFAPDIGPVLGQPRAGLRTLVFQAEGGEEKRLSVDEVVGVERVPVGQLRRLPRAAAAPGYSIGAWLDGDKAVVLVDLHALDSHGSGATHGD
jgi:chemotaxis signal transduction protein